MKEIKEKPLVDKFAQAKRYVAINMYFDLKFVCLSYVSQYVVKYLHLKKT